MKLTFLGTRGYIDARSPEHDKHASLLVTYRGRSVRIDCGEDWLGLCGQADEQAIFLTHCHPDHAFGLRQGAPCPVYATCESWQLMADWPIAQRYTITPRMPVEVAGITFEAFSVEHSTRCPTVGYRITAGRVTVFYAPDIVYLHDREAALVGCRIYIGDGATIDRSFVRKQRDTGALIGHAPVRTQLTWCQKLGVPRMIVTHCGSQIVTAGADPERQIQQYALERGVAAQIATDGMEVVVRC